MNIQIIPADTPLPTPRAWAISMVIKSFKGRKDVEVHLFRPDFDERERDAMDWSEIIEDSHHPDIRVEIPVTAQVVMEAFTAAERDQVVEYLKERYATKLERITVCPMTFPLPLGLTPLSSIPEGKTMGFIRFDQIPHYTLPFAVRGFYDLAQHEPIEK
ncbi:MAG: hypothetical protein H0S85_13985 [Desulfovibrionaceae bacterium]|jgi:hypothetical protein|nr:hypothetical protein [Desulfovibrionaceae bacterium]